jgi:hypothetical protein
MAAGVPSSAADPLSNIGFAGNDRRRLNRGDVSGVLYFRRPRIVNSLLAKTALALKSDDIVLAIFFRAIAKRD